MSQRVKEIIVSHGNCPDGAGSAVVAKVLKPSIEYVRGSHDKIDNQILSAAKKVKNNGTLWIVDIGCDRSTLDTVCELAIEKNFFLGIYEHHVSRSYLASYDLPENVLGEILFDNERCGSKIFYERMVQDYPEKLKNYEEFIRLTNDRDLWKNEDPRSADMSLLHSIYGDEKYVQRYVTDSSVEFSDTEDILVKYEKERLMKRMHYLLSSIEIKVDRNGYKYGIIIGEGKASDVCNVAIHKFGLEYVCMIDYNTKRASIRSNKEFNCAAFSEARGGGGHIRAAGFPIPRENFKLYDE